MRQDEDQLLGDASSWQVRVQQLEQMIVDAADKQRMVRSGQSSKLLSLHQAQAKQWGFGTWNSALLDNQVQVQGELLSVLQEADSETDDLSSSRVVT